MAEEDGIEPQRKDAVVTTLALVEWDAGANQFGKCVTNNVAPGVWSARRAPSADETSQFQSQLIDDYERNTGGPFWIAAPSVHQLSQTLSSQWYSAPYSTDSCPLRPSSADISIEPVVAFWSLHKDGSSQTKTILLQNASKADDMILHGVGLTSYEEKATNVDTAVCGCGLSFIKLKTQAHCGNPDGCCMHVIASDKYTDETGAHRIIQNSTYLGTNKLVSIRRSNGGFMTVWEPRELPAIDDKAVPEELERNVDGIDPDSGGLFAHDVHLPKLGSVIKNEPPFWTAWRRIARFANVGPVVRFNVANSGVLGWKNTTLTHAAALFYRTGNIDWKEGSDAKCFLSVTDAMLTTLISDGSTQKITVDGALDVELGYFADKTPDVTFLRCEIATLPRATDTKAELYSIWQKTTKYYPGIKIVKKHDQYYTQQLIPIVSSALLFAAIHSTAEEQSVFGKHAKARQSSIKEAGKESISLWGFFSQDGKLKVMPESTMHQDVPTDFSSIVELYPGREWKFTQMGSVTNIVGATSNADEAAAGASTDVPVEHPPPTFNGIPGIEANKDLGKITLRVPVGSDSFVEHTLDMSYLDEWKEKFELKREQIEIMARLVQVAQDATIEVPMGGAFAPLVGERGGLVGEPSKEMFREFVQTRPVIESVADLKEIVNALFPTWGLVEQADALEVIPRINRFADRIMSVDISDALGEIEPSVLIRNDFEALRGCVDKSDDAKQTLKIAVGETYASLTEPQMTSVLSSYENYHNIVIAAKLGKMLREEILETYEIRLAKVGDESTILAVTETLPTAEEIFDLYVMRGRDQYVLPKLSTEFRMLVSLYTGTGTDRKISTLKEVNTEAEEMRTKLPPDFANRAEVQPLPPILNELRFPANNPHLTYVSDLLRQQVPMTEATWNVLRIGMLRKVRNVPAARQLDIPQAVKDYGAIYFSNPTTSTLEHRITDTGSRNHLLRQETHRAATLESIHEIENAETALMAEVTRLGVSPGELTAFRGLHDTSEALISGIPDSIKNYDWRGTPWSDIDKPMFDIWYKTQIADVLYPPTSRLSALLTSWTDVTPTPVIAVAKMYAQLYDQDEMDLARISASAAEQSLDNRLKNIINRARQTLNIVQESTSTTLRPKSTILLNDANTLSPYQLVQLLGDRLGGGGGENSMVRIAPTNLDAIYKTPDDGGYIYDDLGRYDPALVNFRTQKYGTQGMRSSNNVEIYLESFKDTVPLEKLIEFSRYVINCQSVVLGEIIGEEQPDAAAYTDAASAWVQFRAADDDAKPPSLASFGFWPAVRNAVDLNFNAVQNTRATVVMTTVGGLQCVLNTFGDTLKRKIGDDVELSVTVNKRRFGATEMVETIPIEPAGSAPTDMLKDLPLFTYHQVRTGPPGQTTLNTLYNFPLSMAVFAKEESGNNFYYALTATPETINDKTTIKMISNCMLRMDPAARPKPYKEKTPFNFVDFVFPRNQDKMMVLRRDPASHQYTIIGTNGIKSVTQNRDKLVAALSDTTATETPPLVDADNIRELKLRKCDPNDNKARIPDKRQIAEFNNLLAMNGAGDAQFNPSSTEHITPWLTKQQINAWADSSPRCSCTPKRWGMAHSALCTP